MATALRTATLGRDVATAPAAFALSRFLDTFTLWRQRALTRRELSRLDNRMLRDIGVSTVDVEAEVTKPFWRA